MLFILQKKKEDKFIICLSITRKSLFIRHCIFAYACMDMVYTSPKHIKCVHVLITQKKSCVPVCNKLYLFTSKVCNETNTSVSSKVQKKNISLIFL